ncbi:MAG: hypothetical protein M1830_005024 [Pleopsidium flavum]|nr:MAG: hypothetical protein M1830_005024 [Pleopsidium flavum]
MRYHSPYVKKDDETSQSDRYRRPGGTMGDVFVATMQRLADILNLEVSQLVEESPKFKERNGEEKGEELDE